MDLRPGQLLHVHGYVEHAPLVRALARAGYRAGASFVDVLHFDQHVNRALIELGPDEALTRTPAWLVKRLEDRAADEAVSIRVLPEPEPDLFADLDGERVGRFHAVELAKAVWRLSGERRIAGSIVGCPTASWARAVFGEPDVERLWQAIAATVRLDEADPVTAWRDHIARLEVRAAALTARDFDAIHFRGPGTDLTVGLLDGGVWKSALDEAARGQRCVTNMPTEEVYTAPDWRRTEGVVRSTRPLPMLGTIVRDLELRFERGHAVDVHATTGADVVRAEMATDEGGSALGEVALVDGRSRVGQTGVTFYEALYDENAS